MLHLSPVGREEEKNMLVCIAFNVHESTLKAIC